MFDLATYLWPSIPKEHANILQSSIKDFSNILVDNGRSQQVITPRDYNKLHKEDATFISNEIMEAKSNKEQRIVVLSHFPPSPTGTFDFTGIPANLRCAIKLTLQALIANIIKQKCTFL